MTRDTGSTMERVRLARSLVGRGIEIGPGNSPLPISSFADVSYLERPYAGGGYLDAHGLDGADALEHESVLYLDVDKEGLSPIPDSSVDFVIACHVVEHLANPVRLLSESARTLRDGGKLLLIVPDRERTFDFGRPGTPVAHVVEEFLQGTQRVNRGHIEAELRHAIGLSGAQAVDDADVDNWRELTVHAHCWTPAEFVALLIYAVDNGWASFTLEDCYFAEHHDRHAGFEFGLLLRNDRARRGRRAAEALLEDFTLQVATRAPGERARWSRLVHALTEVGMISLPWPIDPDALFEIFLDQALAGRVSATHFLDDPVRAVEFAAAHANAPTGLGRVSAYWRGVLAGRTELPHPTIGPDD